jgi:hypothetical protein
MSGDGSSGMMSSVNENENDGDDDDDDNEIIPPSSMAPPPTPMPTAFPPPVPTPNPTMMITAKPTVVPATPQPSLARTPNPTPNPTVDPTPPPTMNPVSCSVCGEGLKVFLPDAIFEFAGQPSVMCGALEAAGQSGMVTPVQCDMLAGLIGQTCGCQSIADGAPIPFHSISNSNVKSKSE